MNATLVFTIRPGGTSLWLPAATARRLEVKRGALLTSDQFASREIQELLAERRAKDRQKGGDQ